MDGIALAQPALALAAKVLDRALRAGIPIPGSGPAPTRTPCWGPTCWPLLWRPGTAASTPRVPCVGRCWRWPTRSAPPRPADSTKSRSRALERGTAPTTRERQLTFDEFVRARLGALLRYAIVLTCDPYLAEEVVQEVLVRAQSRWSRIVGVDQPEAYVRRMVLNEFLSWRRRMLRRALPVRAETWGRGRRGGRSGGWCRRT